ncbi:MAG: carbohydrate ABC transporter permease, partial [Candidatus Methylacidiphilales bacterium]
MSNPAATTSVGRKPSDLISHIIICAIFCIELLPFYMMLQISVKDNTSFMSNPWLPASPANWHWENFSHGLALIGPYIANTVFVAVLGTVVSLFLAIMAAYFFARYRMPGGDIIFGMFMFLMLMPSVANIVPLFTLLKNMSLLNTLWAIITVSIAGGQVFAIFVLKNFIEEIPKDLFEAAEIDGASHFQQMLNVVLPMSAPIIGTLAILMFLGKWNDFMLPLIVLRDKELFTLGVGLIYLNGE